jgi:NAD(P)-dependent dehydrogenase (short-subunit alcohol dehydrogenase family)
VKKLLENRVIIATGAGSGIGRASAAVFAAAGAKIVVADVTEEAGQATVEAIRRRGGTATFIKVNVASEAEVEELVRQTVDVYGRLDGAFNNAGVEHHNKPLHELTAAEWGGVLGVDLTGVFYCMKHEIKAMLESGGGSIVNTASGCSKVAIFNCSEYVAAKHGVIGLTIAAALDYGTRGIRVNAVLPGLTGTEMVKRRYGDPSMAKELEKLKDHQPMGRMGEPTEIGEAAKWLLSDAASFVTGASLPVDGGYLAV